MAPVDTVEHSMFYQLLTGKNRPVDRPAVICGDRLATWGELASQAALLRDRLRSLGHRRIGLVLRPQAASWAALAALDDLQCDVFLLDEQWDAATRSQLAHELAWHAIVQADWQPGGEVDCRVETTEAQARGSGQSSVTILT
jgi:hypothetical protein